MTSGPKTKIIKDMALLDTREFQGIEYKSTNNVALIFFHETLSLPELLSYDTTAIPGMRIWPSRMNRSKHSYCVEMKFPIDDSSVPPNLKVYAAKIKIKGIRPPEKAYELICQCLNDIKSIYNAKLDKGEISISIFSMGIVKNMDQIEFTVRNCLDQAKENNLISTSKKRLVFRSAFIHTTGIKNSADFRVVATRFSRLFSGGPIAPRLTVRGIYSSTSNSTYNLRRPINISKLAALIDTAIGFDKGKSAVIYENIKQANVVNIVLWLDLDEEERQTIRQVKRDRLSTTFTVKSTGAVSQSSPSHDTAVRSFNLFIKALNFLGEDILR